MLEVHPIRATVFGSSSARTSKRMCDVAYEMGQLLARNNIITVNGGGAHGVMGAINNGVRSIEGGKIIGVIHKMFCVDGGEDKLVTDMIIVDGSDLTVRKQSLLDNGDCIIILAGGVGTFDEFWDTVCGKSLGLKGLERKPVCVVNTDGFYDGFNIQLKRAFDDGLLYGTVESYYTSVNTPQEALNWCLKNVQNQLVNSNSDSGNSDSSNSDSSNRKIERIVIDKKDDSTSSMTTLLFVSLTTFTIGILIGMKLRLQKV